MNFFVPANNISSDEVIPLCLRLLADTHLKLHAFTLAEYHYVKIKVVNLNFVQSLIYQNCPIKSEEALTLLSFMQTTVEFESYKDLITELQAK